MDHDMLLIHYRGALRFADDLVERLRATGANVRWQRPAQDPGDLTGQTLVAVELRLPDADEARVQHAISRFREYYPRAQVRVQAPAR